MAKTNKIIIQCCLCGAGTKKEQAPTVPYTPEEISDQVVAVAKAGASIAHIHVRETKVIDGVTHEGYKSMSLQMFTETVELCREKCAKAGVDIIINLTTSGGEYEDVKRLQHLGALKPEMCSFDPNTLNWANAYIFENSPRFLNLLAQEVVKHDIKPEFEIFDTGHLDSAMFYVKKWGIPEPVHMQFIMGVGGAMPGTAENLAFLVGKLLRARRGPSPASAGLTCPCCWPALPWAATVCASALRTTSTCPRALSPRTCSSLSAPSNSPSSPAAKSPRPTTRAKFSASSATACATRRRTNRPSKDNMQTTPGAAQRGDRRTKAIERKIEIAEG